MPAKFIELMLCTVIIEHQWCLLILKSQSALFDCSFFLSLVCDLLVVCFCFLIGLVF